MATLIDASQLANQAKCFCFPSGMQPAVQTYLLAVLAGVDTSDPAGLLNAARNFRGIPAGDQLSVQNYLLSLLVP